MKYFVFSIKIFILTLIILVVSPILNIRYQILDTGIAHAQGVDIGIYPPVFQVQVTPPADVKVPFFIQNFSDQSVDLKLSLKPFTASGEENGQITFLEIPDYPDPFILNRIAVLDNETPINSITLSPKQKRNLNLVLKIPSNEVKGDYYFSIVFASNPDVASNNNFLGASGGIASNILLSVGPQGKTQGILEDFSAPFFVSKGPLPFTVRLRNTSDHYITPKGDIIIKNMFGQSVGKVDLLSVNILSNTIRRIPDSLQSGTASDKNYEKIKAVVKKNQFPVAIWPEKFLLGAYTANITLSLSSQGPVFKKTVMFFAFPIEYIIGILAIIGIVVFIILKVRQRIA